MSKGQEEGFTAPGSEVTGACDLPDGQELKFRAANMHSSVLSHSPAPEHAFSVTSLNMKQDSEFHKSKLVLWWTSSTLWGSFTL